jgi:Parvulin-like peptidyl-prolyl isomerase
MSKTLHTSHILVNNEYEAQDILRLLKEGKDFAELARKYSKCSSAAQGGDLGAQPVSRLDEDYSDAAMLLKPGQISTKPVRTKFGYHIIRRES